MSLSLYWASWCAWTFLKAHLDTCHALIVHGWLTDFWPLWPVKIVFYRGMLFADFFWISMQPWSSGPRQLGRLEDRCGPIFAWKVSSPHAALSSSKGWFRSSSKPWSIGYCKRISQLSYSSPDAITVFICIRTAQRRPLIGFSYQHTLWSDNASSYWMTLILRNLARVSMLLLFAYQKNAKKLRSPDCQVWSRS